MGTPNATKEAAALAITALGDRISAHTGDPGTTGANEATGGSPAYARKQTTWTGGSSDGSVPGSQIEWDVPAGTYSHFGVWSAGGTFIIGYAMSSPATFVSQGKLQFTPTVDVTAAT